MSQDDDELSDYEVIMPNWPHSDDAEVQELAGTTAQESMSQDLTPITDVTHLTRDNDAESEVVRVSQSQQVSCRSHSGRSDSRPMLHQSSPARPKPPSRTLPKGAEAFHDLTLQVKYRAPLPYYDERQVNWYPQ